jgi:hypothetical protein
VSTRDREVELRDILRSARSEPVGMALEGICSLDLERIKSRLLDAPSTEVDALQGEGRAIRRILKYLTERPLPQPTRFDNDVPTNL